MCERVAASIDATLFKCKISCFFVKNGAKTMN